MENRNPSLTTNDLMNPLQLTILIGIMLRDMDRIGKNQFDHQFNLGSVFSINVWINPNLTVGLQITQKTL